jgi:hypothetical protein
MGETRKGTKKSVSSSNPLDWKIFRGQSKERWRPEKKNMEAWG